MKIYNLKCPNCGATLSTDVKNKAAKCDYCGNEFIISEDSENADESKNAVSKEVAPKPQNHLSEEINAPSNPPKRKKSRTKDYLIVFTIIIVGLILNYIFDR